MAIFYILHTLYPETGESDGKRNSRIFICGILMYILAYICFRHLHITGVIPELYFGTLQTCFFIMFVADVSVMAWIYKNHFGKNILSDVFGGGSGNTSKELPYDGTLQETQQDTTSENCHEEKGNTAITKHSINKDVNPKDSDKSKKSGESKGSKDTKKSGTSKKSNKTKSSKRSSNMEIFEKVSKDEQ
jgi:hypothetical protein